MKNSSFWAEIENYVVQAQLIWTMIEPCRGLKVLVAIVSSALLDFLQNSKVR